jgi:MEDS: MEthanogen/methylotroph, DcmR Sensory domain
VTTLAARDGGRFHTVRFYEDDTSLCRLVAEFIGDGLAARQPAVIIATPDHRERIAQALRPLSFDADQLCNDGDLLLLDADQTLSTFMKDGFPDATAFRGSIGSALDRVIARRSPATVRAYGEMVDSLWKAGATDAAIRLEVLWNELANARTFSLLCGYSMGNFYKHGAYEEICRHHTHVMSTVGQLTRIGVA